MLSQIFFLVLSPNGIQVIFSPILKKISLSQDFFLEDLGYFHPVNTHTSYMLTLSFNLMAIVCVIANIIFFIYQK